MSSDFSMVCPDCGGIVLFYKSYGGTEANGSCEKCKAHFKIKLSELGGKRFIRFFEIRMTMKAYKSSPLEVYYNGEWLSVADWIKKVKKK